ncbi:MAG: hypothetical protein ACKO22_11800 [Cyanobium sp.]
MPSLPIGCANTDNQRAQVQPAELGLKLLNGCRRIDRSTDFSDASIDGDHLTVLNGFTGMGGFSDSHELNRHQQQEAHHGKPSQACRDGKPAPEDGMAGIQVIRQMHAGQPHKSNRGIVDQSGSGGELPNWIHQFRRQYRAENG